MEKARSVKANNPTVMMNDLSGVFVMLFISSSLCSLVWRILRYQVQVVLLVSF